MERNTRRSLADHLAAAEFDLDANAPATPSEFALGSKAKVWWRCSTVPEHGLWRATVNNRTKPRGSGCPACHGNRIQGAVPADRSLQARFPQVACELDPDRSGFSAGEVTYGSKRVAWWRCSNGHEYTMTVNQRTHRSRPQGCPYCSGRRVAPERSLAAVAADIAAELDTGKSGVMAEMLMPNSNRRVWWRCAADAQHAWQATPNNRVSRGSGCPFCSGAMVSDANRLSVNSPDPRLLAEWDYERNKPLTPRDVSTGSGRKVWWACNVAADHRWSSSVSKRVSGQGCPFCAGTRVSSTNRLSALRPDVARELDADISSVTADQLSLGSSRLVTWRCTVDDRHVWRARVINRTSGREGRGTGCPYCQLPGTSAQELQLKAELAAVLPVDVDCTAVANAERGTERVDIVIADSDSDLRLIVEFDGSWWHSGPSVGERDAAKTTRLQRAGWTVIRVREDPLPLIDPELDVSVALGVRASDAAAMVLERMAALGLIPAEQARHYRRRSANGPINAELADRMIRSRLGSHAADPRRQSQDEAWDQMYNALAAFAAQHGHCRVPDDVEVRGVSLSRWIQKQRTRYYSGGMPAERADRLEAIQAWSFDPLRVTGFWAGRASYLSITNSGEPSISRSATVWASNLRARRQRLLNLGSDLPADQLQAMAEVPGWQWSPPEDAFQAKITVLRDYLGSTGKSVAHVRQRDHWGEHRVGTWINSWRTRRDQMPERHRRALEELPGWTWSARDSQWEDKLRELADFARSHGHVRPSLAAASEHERALAVWKRNNKNRLQGQRNERSSRLRELLARYGEQLL